MPKYNVTLPIAGTVHMEIEADSEEEAIEKAIDTEWGIGDISSPEAPIELVELDLYDKLVEGNCVNVTTHEAEAEEID